MWDAKNRYVEGFAPGTLSGGLAFSLNFYPFIVTFTSFALGLFGCGLLITSCYLARDDRRRVLTFLHIGSGIILIPVFIALLLFIRRCLQ